MRTHDQAEAATGWRLGERTLEVRTRLLRSLGSRPGFLSRRLRHPKPWLSPARQRRVDVKRPGALGDVLMCTPALRELKRRNPACHVRFFTRFPSLVEGLPYIDEVVADEPFPAEAIYPTYEDVIPPRRHIAAIFGDCLGVRVDDIHPDCVVRPELVEAYRAGWGRHPRPHIVVNRRAGPWTPNKDWPDDLWRALAERLRGWATVIDIGSTASPQLLGGGDLDLRGRTDLDGLVAAVAAADIHIGPISGPVHIAAAVGTPAVVIYGGYEHPECSSYPGNVSLSTRLECSPCWLRGACPRGLECLRRISPEAVERSVRQIWARIRQRVAEG